MAAASTTDTRTQLLDVSRELLQVRGFNAFSHRDVANRVGVKSSSVHYYFPTKDDIGLALMAEYRADMESFFGSLVGIKDPRERLARFFDLFEQTARAREKVCMAGMLASDYQTLGEALRAEVRGFYARIEAWLSRQALALAPDRSEAAAAELAKMAFSMLEGALLSSRVFDEAARVSQAGRAIQAMFEMKVVDGAA